MRTIMLMMAGWLLCMAASAQKETRIYQFDKPLYGAAYYAEYTPTNRLDEDIRLMKEAHLTVVRVGESTWSLFEPQDGQFEFAWMDRIIDALHKAGIKVLFSQPFKRPLTPEIGGQRISLVGGACPVKSNLLPLWHEI